MNSGRNVLRCIWLVAIASAGSPALASPGEYFGIHVVDDQTGRGVPLVQLEMTDHECHLTDSNGYVAFNEPGLMNQDVWFGISSCGYDGPDAGLGYRGAVLHTTPGTIAEVKVHRLNIAQRLYRTTGYGIYCDTVQLGKTPPIQNGLLDGKVMGQDTVQTVIYHGQMLWLWGDTDRPSYPLGNFHTSGAVTALPADLDVNRGINYTYFTDPRTGFARGMAELHRNDALPVWLDGLMVVPDPQGHDRLFSHYAVTKNLVPVETGLLIFDDSRQLFTEFTRIRPETRLTPSGHPTRVRSNGTDYFYFAAPYPTVRVQADWAHVTHPDAYEGYTCLRPGASANDPDGPLNRDADHKLLWTWQRGVEPTSPQQVTRWIAQGRIQPDESPFQMRNVDDGRPLRVAAGSVAWNPYLHQWTMLFVQAGGLSNLGEIWFAQANAPEGPWRDARKVATHAAQGNNNDFYNPMQHPEFARENGRIVYFEGTFANTFEATRIPTPRYTYNNLMYKLDLADPRMKLPPSPPGLSNAEAMPPGG